MKEENLIKSKNRVQKHGEVFTPSWMVEKMLDIPGIKEASESITATFFEPSAGDGNFLQAILERKLKTVTEKYSNKVWKTKSLFALSSIYGVELLEDNLQVARDRLFLFYLNWYEKSFGEQLETKSNVYQSAYYIIHKNIVRGNTLTQRHPDTNELIQLNEWQAVKGRPSMIKRVPFTLAELLGKEVENDPTVVEGQLSFFDFDETFMADENTEVFEPISIQKVYLLGE